MSYERSNGDLWHRISKNESETENPESLAAFFGLDAQQVMPITINMHKGDFYAKSEGFSRYSTYIQINCR